jgi:hypothetical protein
MSSPWARVSDHAWVDDWREFLRAAQYEAELRGGDFDVWTALAEALHVWLDHYEGVAAPMSDVDASPDALRSALSRLHKMVPVVGVPGGQFIGSVLASSMGFWARRQTNNGSPSP